MKVLNNPTPAIIIIAATTLPSGVIGLLSADPIVVMVPKLHHNASEGVLIEELGSVSKYSKAIEENIRGHR